MKVRYQGLASLSWLDSVNKSRIGPGWAGWELLDCEHTSVLVTRYLTPSSLQKMTVSHCHTYAWFSLHDDPAYCMIARSCIALLVQLHDLHEDKDDHKNDELFYYSKHNWSQHIFPNGPPQLLRQQEYLHTNFRYSGIIYQSHGVMFDIFGEELPMDSSIEWAASLGLVDLLKTHLDAQPWEGTDLSSAFVASMQSDCTQHICMQCFHAILTSGVDVNANTYCGAPLYCASESSASLEFVKVLLEKGADLNTAGGGPFSSPLQASAHSGNLEIVCFLVENGADVNEGGGYYGSALQAGAQSGNLEIVCFLVQHGADVNARGGEYGSALEAGAQSGNLEIVCFLVANGADVHSRGGEYGSLLQAGGQSGNLEIVRFLVESEADVNVGGGKYGSVLQVDAHSGNLEVVRFLVDNGAGVNAGGEYYGSALQAGAQRGSLEIVSFLVESGADVNARGGEYGLALQASAQRGNLEITCFLVENGAEVNAIVRDKETELDGIAHRQRYWNSTERGEILRFLKSRGAKTWEKMADLSNDIREDMEALGWPPLWDARWLSG
ncbi:putative multiple ankyrin repeats single kh domain protein [Flagelloscypha sp. PMI_526]|nr:putative multiple ankyrin repeats single kh domain protein [Flagelloscypha sp. PMI_526]